MCIGILFLIAEVFAIFEIILGVLIYIVTKEDAGLFAIFAGVLGLIGIFIISVF
jgi:hypothetical protein